MTEGSVWQQAPAFILTADEVHVLRASLEVDDATLLAYWRSLSSEERARADRFHFEEHRRRFVAARGILRSLIGRYTNAPPAEVQFEYSSNGKPSVREPKSPIQFNLSHSENLLAIAFAVDAEIGVDIEKNEPRSGVMEISERFFTPEEHAQIEQQEDGGRTEMFFRFWTAKEAVMKACGLGLSLEPNAIAIALDPLRIVSIRADVSSEWALRAFQPAIGFTGTLAIHPSIKRCEYFEWSAGESIRSA